MESELANVNWLAVIVGTIVAFLLGWLWYSPALFGKKWAEGSRVELGGAETMPVMAMVTQLLALFLLALVVGITATREHLLTAILAILAAAFFTFSGGAFVRKTNYALMVDISYVVLAGVVMIVCQGIF
ncbi:MAG: DUF1761 family protein [Pseudomonadota bacterium]